MTVYQIKEVITGMKAEIAVLEGRLKEIQGNCEHHFEGNQYYEVCIKCDKANVLYY